MFFTPGGITKFIEAETRIGLGDNDAERSGFENAAAFGVVLAEADAGLRLDELGDPAGREEHVRAHRAAEEHVVVGVEEVLGQALDVVQLALDGVRVVGGQHRRVGEELLAAHDGDRRMLGQPGGRGESVAMKMRRTHGANMYTRRSAYFSSSICR